MERTSTAHALVASSFSSIANPVTSVCRHLSAHHPQNLH